MKSSHGDVVWSRGTVEWRAIAVVVAAGLAACGGGANPDASPPAGSTTPAPGAAPPVGTVTPALTTPDSGAPPKPGGTPVMSKRGDSAASTTGIGTKTPRDSAPLHDSAFGPMFTVDSNGKIVPVKRP